MNLDEVVSKLREIRAMGYIKTHRAHDTGVGKTLEDLLGIAENNVALPDLGTVELKAKRIDSSCKLTLATKAPHPRGANKRLFEAYRYLDDTGRYCLHCTLLASRLNPQRLGIRIDDESISILNPNSIQAFWPMGIFETVLRSKSERIVLVFAETRGKAKSPDEQFHYVEAHLLSGLDSEKFRRAVMDGKLKVEIRIGSFRSGSREGRYHDHGTAFRIHSNDYLNIFASDQRLM